MYLLDTNVISELRRAPSGRADANVVRWVETCEAATCYLSAVTVLELEMGVLAMERRDARQGAALRAWLERQVLDVFARRVLPIDTKVAVRCASLHVPDPRPERDALIAATALVHGLCVVTRNTADFAPTKVSLRNPWKAHEW